MRVSNCSNLKLIDSFGLEAGNSLESSALTSPYA